MTNIQHFVTESFSFCSHTQPWYNGYFDQILKYVKLTTPSYKVVIRLQHRGKVQLGFEYSCSRVIMDMRLNDKALINHRNKSTTFFLFYLLDFCIILHKFDLVIVNKIIQCAQ